MSFRYRCLFKKIEFLHLISLFPSLFNLKWTLSSIKKLFTLDCLFWGTIKVEVLNCSLFFFPWKFEAFLKSWKTNDVIILIDRQTVARIRFNFADPSKRGVVYDWYQFIALVPIVSNSSENLLNWSTRIIQTNYIQMVYKLNTRILIKIYAQFWPNTEE